MKSIFREGQFSGDYPVEEFQVCFYDGTRAKDNTCYDEAFVKPEEFDYLTLASVETEEEQKEPGDHTRVFAHMKNGEVFVK